LAPATPHLRYQPGRVAVSSIRLWQNGTKVPDGDFIESWTIGGICPCSNRPQTITPNCPDLDPSITRLRDRHIASINWREGASRGRLRWSCARTITRQSRLPNNRWTAWLSRFGTGHASSLVLSLARPPLAAGQPPCHWPTGGCERPADQPAWAGYRRDMRRM
jgi:hypothetical protein